MNLNPNQSDFFHQDRHFGEPEPEPTASHAWGGLIRSGSITIDDDGDFATYASSGTGSEIDPWILQGFLIECNYSSYGVLVMNTDDYFVFQNSYINESWDDPTYGFAIATSGVRNGIFRNVTIENIWHDGIVIFESEHMAVEDCTISNSTRLGAFVMLNCIDSNNTRFENNTVLNSTSQGINVIGLFKTSNNVNVTGNIINSSYTGMVLRYCRDVLIESNSIHNSSWHQITMDDSVNVTIKSNDLNRHSNIGVEIHDCQGFSFENNTITNNTIGGDENIYVADSTNFNITGNRFLTKSDFIGSIALSNNCSNAIISDNIDDPRPLNSYAGITIATAIENITIQNNTIYNATTHGAINLNGNNITIQNNTIVGCNWGIYAGHFDTLDAVVIRNNTFRDFNTNQAFYLLDKNMNLTITLNKFENVSTYLYNISTGGNQIWERNYYQDYFKYFPYAITTNTSMIELEYPYVINSITGQTDEHPYYYSGWFPRGEKEISFYVYSSIDDMGITYEWFKFYLDNKINVRQFGNPKYVLYRVTVKDFGNRILYDRIFNLNSSEDAIEVGLQVTTLVLDNKFDVPVIFEFTRSGVTTSFPLAGGDTFNLRVLIGTFTYRVLDENGTHLMQTENNEDITGTKLISGPTTLSWGFIELPPIGNETIINQDSPWVSLSIFGGFIGVALGGFWLLSTYIRTRLPKRRKQQWREH